MVEYCSIPILVPVEKKNGKKTKEKRFNLVMDSLEDAYYFKQEYHLRSQVNTHKQKVDLGEYYTDMALFTNGVMGPLLPSDYVKNIISKYNSLVQTVKQLVRLDKTLIVIANTNGSPINDLADLVESIEPSKLDSFLHLLDLEKDTEIKEQTFIFKYDVSKKKSVNK